MDDGLRSVSARVAQADRDDRPRGQALAVAGAVVAGLLDLLALHRTGSDLGAASAAVDVACAALLAAAGVTAHRHDPAAGAGLPLLVMAAAWVLGALPAISLGAAVVFWVALGCGVLRSLLPGRPDPLDRREVLPVVLVAAGAAVATLVVTVAAAPGGSFRPPGPAQLPAVALIAVIPLAVLGVAARRRIGTTRALGTLSRGASAPTLESVQEMLAEALGDPALTVHFPGLGSPVGALERGVTVAITSDTGEEIAQVRFSSSVRRRPALVRTVLLAARPALDNARLLASNQEQLRLLRETRKLVASTALQERQRMERDLHDGAQQRLLTLSMRLEIARLQIADPAIRRSIQQVRDELRAAHRELRDMANTVFPAVLDTAGLAAALDVVAEQLPMVLHVMLGTERFDPTAETVAYFAAHDLLVDIARAGQPKSESVTATVTGGLRADLLWLRIEVEDDPDTAGLPSSSTISLVADRLHALDGSITHTRHGPGGRSVIDMEIPVRVIVADDLPLFREGLAMLLSAAGIEVVDQAKDAVQAVTLAAHHRPDIVIMDIRMPPRNADDGLVAAQELKSRFPTMGVLILSAYVESASAARLLDEIEGGVGYLLKERVDDIQTLTDALDRIDRGEAVIDHLVVRSLLGRRRRPDSPLTTLTERESDVLRLMAEGRTNAGIAQMLALAPKTVETHVARVFDKLGLAGTGADAAGRNRRVLAVLAWLKDEAGRTGQDG